MILERIVFTYYGKFEGERRTKVAQMVRSGETRTPGTKASTAGNGGRLEIDKWAGKTRVNGAKGEEPVVDEVIVIVTCLVMLKKEIDRRRVLQTLVVSSSV